MPYPYESSSFDTSSMDEVDLRSLGLSLGEPTLPVLGRIPSIPTREAQVFVDESHRVTVRGPAGRRSTSRQTTEQAAEKGGTGTANSEEPRLVNGPKPFRIDAVTDSPTRFDSETEATNPAQTQDSPLRRVDTPVIRESPVTNEEQDTSEVSEELGTASESSITAADRLSYALPHPDRAGEEPANDRNTPAARALDVPPGIAGWLVQLEAFSAAYSRVIILAVLLTATGLTLLLLRGGAPAIDSLPAELPTLPTVEQAEMARQSPAVPEALLSEEAEPFLPPLQLAQRPSAPAATASLPEPPASTSVAESHSSSVSNRNAEAGAAFGPGRVPLDPESLDSPAAESASLQAGVTGPTSMAYPSTGQNSPIWPGARGPASNRVETASPQPVATLPGRIQSPPNTYSPR